jgi:hypothetical protein
MNIISIDSKTKQSQRKAEMLEVLEEIKKLVENDEVSEFVACSQGDHGLQIHASCLDTVGGIGMFEVGKHLLIEMKIKS